MSATWRVLGIESILLGIVLGIESIPKSWYRPGTIPYRRQVNPSNRPFLRFRSLFRSKFHYVDSRCGLFSLFLFSPVSFTIFLQRCMTNVWVLMQSYCTYLQDIRPTSKAKKKITLLSISFVVISSSKVYQKQRNGIRYAILKVQTFCDDFLK